MIEILEVRPLSCLSSSRHDGRTKTFFFHQPRLRRRREVGRHCKVAALAAMAVVEGIFVSHASGESPNPPPVRISHTHSGSFLR